MLIIPELLFTVTVLVTAAYLFWAVPKKITAVFFLPLMLASYLASIDLLGWPAPIWAEWRLETEGTYVSHQLNEPNAIYVWVEMDGIPRSYAFPWSEELAKKLEGAKEKEEKKGTKLKLRFNGSYIPEDMEQMFYDDPQQANPPKAQ